VVDGQGRLIGLLTRDGIIHALRAGGAATPVAEAMHREIPRITRRTPLAGALAALSRAGGAPAVAVEDTGGRLAGLITPANIADLIALRGTG
jgi:stage IV sporulation protein FB